MSEDPKEKCKEMKAKFERSVKIPFGFILPESISFHKGKGTSFPRIVYYCIYGIESVGLKYYKNSYMIGDRIVEDKFEYMGKKTGLGEYERKDIEIIAAKKIKDVWYFLGKNGSYYKILYRNMIKKSTYMNLSSEEFDEIIRGTYCI